MTTDCPDEALLFAFLEDVVTDEERARVEGHLESCQVCRGSLAALRADEPTFVEPELPETFWDRYDQRFEEELCEERSRGFFGRLRRLWNHRVAVPAPLVATAALAIVLLFVWNVSTVGRPIGLAIGQAEDRVLLQNVDTAVSSLRDVY